MSGAGSYQIKHIASNVDAEINRLKAQVELFWDKEFKRYKDFGLTGGLNVIELGAGPGFVAGKILEAFPDIIMTALEIEPLLADYARAYLSKKYKQCKVVEGSIMETGFPDGSFDFAVIRLVLEHLPDPAGAVREVFRILRPGGKAIFVDNDFEMHIMAYPNVSELRDLYDAYCRSRFDEGGNPKIGRELPRILKDGGFSNIDFEVISAHSDIVGDEIFFKSEGIGIPTKLVQDGYLSSKTLGKISVEWRNMIKNESHSIIRQIYMAVGEKRL